MNLYGDEWDDSSTEPGYEWRRLRVARRLGGERIGASVYAVRNESRAAARVLMISTMIEPEIAEYPDSGKLGVFAGVAPGGPNDRRTLERFVRNEPLAYYDGERRTDDPG